MRRILIADDHAVVRRGLREIIADHPDMAEPGEVEDFPALVEAVRDGDWDAVVLDIKMPGGNALDALARLRRMEPELPVLVLSGQAEDQFAVRMIKSGAAGYMTKESAPDELMEAVRTVLAGRRWVSPTLGGELAAALAEGHDRPRHELLSDREFQVFLRIAQGESTSEIAEDLHLSSKTVSTYRRRLLDKMDMSADAELVRYALERGLI